MYDVGYVDSFVSYRMLEKAFDREDRPLTDAVISIPRTLIDIDADLSEILRHWIALPVSKGYIKREAERELMLCREMEAAGCVDKHFIFKMITMAFDETDGEMHQMWRAMYTAENKRKAFDAPAALPDLSSDELKTLERAYRICDLLYQYANKCGRETFIEPVNAAKRQLSEKMMQLLDRDQLENKKCPGCGRELPWAYPYSLCDDCYEQKHGRPRSAFDGQLRLYL
jgi:ATP-dependent RNA helicase SUPV3L1/SUV3